MTGDARAAALQSIRTNIAKFGHHNYLILGGPLPRFAYSIGLSETVGSELVMAGGCFYTADEVRMIIDAVSAQLSKLYPGEWPRVPIDIGSLGVFSLRDVDASWCSSLLLGALDFYGVDHIAAHQIVPEGDRWTIDVPALNRPWSAKSEPVWQWVQEPWLYPVPKDCTVVTNLDALRGKAITEVARWEPDQWEMFAGAGPDVDKEDVRVVPLGTLLGADHSLEMVTTLEVGRGVWRDREELRWQPWTTAPDS